MKGRKIVLYIYLGMFALVALFNIIRVFAPDFLENIRSFSIDQLQPIYFAVFACALYKGKSDTICKIGIGFLFTYILFVFLISVGVINIYDLYAKPESLRLIKMFLAVVLATMKLFGVIALLNAFDTASIKLDIIKSFAIISNGILIVTALSEFAIDVRTYEMGNKANQITGNIAGLLVFAFIILHVIDNYNGASKDNYYDYDFDSLKRGPQLVQNNGVSPQAAVNSNPTVSEPQIINEMPVEQPIDQPVEPAPQPIPQPAPQPAPVQQGPVSLVQAIQNQQNNTNGQ